MAVPGRDPSLYGSGAGATIEAGAPPCTAAHHHHAQGGQARPGGHWQAAGTPSARQELWEWVLALPVAGWDVFATSENSGGTVRESYSLSSSIVHQANGVPPESFPTMSGLNRALGSIQVTEATQDPPGTAVDAAVGEDEGTGMLAPPPAEGLEAGM